jgi:hypothetical protein
MAVAQPDFLHIFNNASGTTPTQYGSQASGYVIQAGTSPTNYEWNPQAQTPTGGFLDVKTKQGGSIPYMTTAAAAPGAALETVNMAIAFKVDSVDAAVGGSFLVGGAGGGQALTRFRATPPAGGGDFDLDLQMETSGSFGYSPLVVASALTFGSFYQFACSIQIVTGDMQLRYKLGSNATVTPAAQSGGADSYTNNWPALNVALQSGFSTYGGLDGQYYYFAYQRGGTHWSSADLGDINSDPSAAFTGFWPGAAPPPADPLWPQACL